MLFKICIYIFLKYVYIYLYNQLAARLETTCLLPQTGIHRTSHPCLGWVNSAYKHLNMLTFKNQKRITKLVLSQRSFGSLIKFYDFLASSQFFSHCYHLLNSSSSHCLYSGNTWFIKWNGNCSLCIPDHGTSPTSSKMGSLSPWRAGTDFFQCIEGVILPDVMKCDKRLEMP